MTPTQTQQRQFDYERQVFAASMHYATTLVAKLTGVERSSVRTALIYDTQCALNFLSQQGSSGEIPDELVDQAMEQQASDRLAKWGR